MSKTTYTRAESAKNRMLGSLVFFGLILSIGTFGFKILGPQNQTFIDAFYMTLLMVATVGYGAGVEIYHHQGLELFTCVLVICGISNLTFFFSMATAWIIEVDTDPSRRLKNAKRH